MASSALPFSARIPKVLHYCFGFDPQFGGKPWSLVHYVCVKSAIKWIRPEKTLFYYEYEPSGPWWERTRTLLTPVRVIAPREIFGNALRHPAHRADVVRLETLIREGGIYLDADVIVHRDFDDLLNNSVVLGEESGVGLGNAIILAEAGAPFLRKWHEEYRSFRSKGKDDLWNEHSVKVPLSLSKKYPDALTILPHTAFCSPGWTEQQLLQIYGAGAPSGVQSKYANHLWESVAWDNYLANLTPRMVRRIDSPFHIWARPYVADLPDNYGESKVGIRFKRNARKKSLKVMSRLVRPKQALSKFLDRLELVASPFVRGFSPKAYDRWQRRRVFRNIYRRGSWGIDGQSKFHSGGGSRGIAADTYVNEMSKILANYVREYGRPVTVVDLGCGDFDVGRELLAKIDLIRYVGCDIVPELIAYHSKNNSDDRASFKLLDMVCDEVPSGDVCLIRHVFQHLPNADILITLDKLRGFEKVYVTESYPGVVQGPVNPDMQTSFGVRYSWHTGCGRGVELDKKPFDVRTKELFRVVFVEPSQFSVTLEVDVRHGDKVVS